MERIALQCKAIGVIASCRYTNKLIVGDFKVEVKFSLAHTNHKTSSIRENCFTINHVSEQKDWDRLVFLGINPKINESLMFFITKKSFPKCIKETSLFSHQQGGKKQLNDDFMIASSKLINLAESKYVRNIHEW